MEFSVYSAGLDLAITVIFPILMQMNWLSWGIIDPFHRWGAGHFTGPLPTLLHPNLWVYTNLNDFLKTKQHKLKQKLKLLLFSKRLGFIDFSVSLPIVASQSKSFAFGTTILFLTFLFFLTSFVKLSSLKKLRTVRGPELFHLSTY